MHANAFCIIILMSKLFSNVYVKLKTIAGYGLHSFFLLCMCVRVLMCTCHSECVEFRGQLSEGVSSFYHGFWGGNSGYQAWAASTFFPLILSPVLDCSINLKINLLGPLSLKVNFLNDIS